MRLHPLELLGEARSDQAWARLQALLPWPARARRLTRGRFDFLLPHTPSMRVDTSLRQLGTALLDTIVDPDPRLGASFGHATGPAADVEILFEAATSALERLGHHFGVLAHDPAAHAHHLETLRLRAELIDALDRRPEFGFRPLADRSGRLVGGVPDFSVLSSELGALSPRALYRLARGAGCLERLWMQAARHAGEALARADATCRPRLWIEIPSSSLLDPLADEGLGAVREWLEALDVDLGLRLTQLPKESAAEERLLRWASKGSSICAPLSQAARGGVDAAPLHALEVDVGSQQELTASSWTASVIFALARAARGRRLTVFAFGVSNRNTETQLWHLGVDAQSVGSSPHDRAPATDGS